MRAASRSVLLSAYAWGGLAVGVLLLPVLGSSARALLLGLVLALPVAFTVLTVLAVRAARRGRGTGRLVSTWAVLLAMLDVVGAAVLLVGLAFTVRALVWWAQCDNGATCQLFTF